MMTESLFSLDDISIASDVATAVDDVYSRLVFLLESMKLELPTWLKYKLPFAENLSKPRVLWSPLLSAAYRKGEIYGEGSVDEIRQCLDKVLSPELKTFDDRKKFWDYVGSLATGLFTENEEVYLEEVVGGGMIEKFNSGFAPFDQAIGGFYQSIITVAGTPGSGKTSLILSLMGELVKNFPVWYFQTEIPAKIIYSRISQIRPKNIVPGSKIFCGNYSSESILERVKKEPDQNRIIIYDSPEVKTSGVDPIQYFEKVYQDLVSMKMESRAIIVTSQTKQGIGWEDLGVYSLSDSAAKARYTDIILYLGRILDTVLVKTGKNRFGQLGQSMTKYDYANLTLVDDKLGDMFE